MTKTSSSFRNPNSIPLFTNSFFLVSPNPSASPSSRQHTGQFPQKTVLLTAAQTQDLDVIPQLRLRESQNRRRKKHGLIVGMGYQ
jgi:hypothetical protein